VLVEGRWARREQAFSELQAEAAAAFVNRPR
jgi:hypothetical protein